MRTTVTLLVAVSLATGCAGDHSVETAEAASAPSAAASPVTSAAPSAASVPVPLRESRAGLLARAAVREADARAAALRRVPGGTVLEAELEEEDGTLVYSYDIRLADGSGVMDVEVDATTGRVLGVERDDDGDDAGVAARGERAGGARTARRR